MLSFEIKKGGWDKMNAKAKDGGVSQHLGHDRNDSVVAMSNAGCIRHCYNRVDLINKGTNIDRIRIL